MMSVSFQAPLMEKHLINGPQHSISPRPVTVGIDLCRMFWWEMSFSLRNHGFWNDIQGKTLMKHNTYRIQLQSISCQAYYSECLWYTCSQVADIQRAYVALVELITKVFICLHNYLWLIDNAGYQPSRFIDCEVDDGSIIPGDWTRETNDDANVVQIQRIGGNRYTFEAGQAREQFKNYFNDKGSIPWQYDHVRNWGNGNA